MSVASSLPSGLVRSSRGNLSSLYTSPPPPCQIFQRSILAVSKLEVNCARLPPVFISPSEGLRYSITHVREACSSRHSSPRRLGLLHRVSRVHYICKCFRVVAIKINRELIPVSSLSRRVYIFEERKKKKLTPERSKKIISCNILRETHGESR